MAWSAEPPAAGASSATRGDDAPPGSPAPQSSPGWRGRNLATALAVIALSGLLAIAFLVDQRTRAQDEGRRLTEAFATVVDEQVTRTVQALDQRLELVALALARAEPPEPATADMLDTQLQKLPFAASLLVLDAQGRLREATPGAGSGPDSHADADYFRLYRTRPGAGFVLGAPRLVGTPGQWVLPASRPILDATGQFAGVVVAMVQASWFDAAWRSLALESGSAMSVMRTDGTMMLRSPLDHAAMQRNYAQGALFTQFLPLGASGSFRMASPVDDSLRMSAYRTLGQQPDLVVVVGRTMDAVLAGWRQTAWLVALAWLLGSLTLVGAVLRMGRLTAQHAAADRHARSLAQRMAMASDATGLVLWDWDPRLDHWQATPSQDTVLGYPPRSGPTRAAAWTELLHPDDRPVVEAAHERVRQGTRDDCDYEIRLRHADGSYRWAHTVGRVQERDTQGRPTRIIGVRMDITERKRAERERTQMLERITDGFVALDLEWRFVFANRQAGDLLGRDPQDLIGKTIWTEFPPLPDETFPQRCQQAMADQKPARLEAWYPDLGMWLEDHIYPSPDGMSIYFRDITQRKSDEFALRQAKEHAENLIAHANVMIVGLDADGEVTLFNRAAQEVTGYAMTDLAGRNWFDVLCPRARYPQVWEEFERLIRAGPVQQFENPILTRNGSERTIAWQNTVLRDGDTITGTLSFGIDVTARCQAERDLDESRDQFETLAQNSIQGIALVRRGQLAYINPALCAIAGRTAVEITSRSLPELMHWLHPDDRADSMARQRRALGGEPEQGMNELRILHGSGQWRWVQSALRSITLRGETAMLAMVIDIHDRKLAEVALRASEALMRQMADAISQMFWLLDMREGHFLYISPAVESVLGCSAAELQGNPQYWRRFIVAHDLARAEKQLDLARQTGRYDLELRLQHPDGSLRWVHARAYPVLGPDQAPYRCAGVIEDITARKMLEIREVQEREILQYLASDRPMHAVLERFVLGYEAMVPDMRASVLLVEGEGDGARVRHGAAPHLPKVYCDAVDGQPIGPAAGSCGTAAYTAQTVIADDIATDPRWVDYRELAMQHGLRACWSVPILGMQGKVVGTFAFYFDRPRKATADELATIERGAHLASQSIERHLAARALRDSEERYRALVESSPAGIAVHQAGRLVYANPAAAEILGAASASQLVGRDMRDFVAPQDRAAVDEAVARILAADAAAPLVQRRMLRLDGSAIDAEVKASPIMFGGEPAVQVVLRDVTARNRAEAELRDSRQQLRVLSAKVLAAQETERRRIAHELHDELGQALTAIKINLQAQDPLQPGAAGGAMAENIRIVDAALQHVRGLALALRPSMLDDLGLVPALRWLVEQTTARNEVQVQLQVPTRLDRLAPDLETAVFRIVQEALTNIVRHAQARHARVRIDVPQAGTWFVRISDDGVGFDVAAMQRRAAEGNSIGVLGMQERAMLVGAELAIDAAPGAGCTVTLRCTIHPATVS